MKLRICRCVWCKAGRKTPFAQAQIKRAKRHNRQQCKIKLKTGDYKNIVNITPGVYTD